MTINSLRTDFLSLSLLYPQWRQARALAYRKPEVNIESVNCYIGVKFDT